MVTRDLRADLAAHRLLAILRGPDPAALLRSLETLAGAGVRLAEVSLTSTGAADVISRAAADLGGELRLGAGTVVTAGDAQVAADAGASFVVSPGLGDGVEAALALGLPAMAGALTPTEVQAGWRLGVSAVKLFPASLGGPGYLRALRDPFPGVCFVPVGGVRPADAGDWLQAGALAIGIGSPLLGDAVRGGDQAALAARARRLVESLSAPAAAGAGRPTAQA